MLLFTTVMVLALIGNVHPYKFYFRNDQSTQQPEDQKPGQVVDNSNSKNSGFPIEQQSLLQQHHQQQPYYTIPLLGSLPSLRPEQQQLPLASQGTKGEAPLQQPLHSRQPQALAYVIIRPIQPQYQFLERLHHDGAYPRPPRPDISVYRDQQQSSSSAGGTKGGQGEEIPEQHQQQPFASKGGRDEGDELQEQQQQLPLQQQKLSNAKGGRDQSGAFAGQPQQQEIVQQKQDERIKGQQREEQGKVGDQGQGQGQENQQQQQESFEEVKKGKFHKLKAHLEQLAAAAKAKMTFSSYEYDKEEIVSTEKPQEQEQIPDKELEQQQEQLSQQQLQEIDEGRNQQASSKSHAPTRQPVKEPQLPQHQQSEQQPLPVLQQQLHDDGFEVTKSKDLPPREQQRTLKGQEPQQLQQLQQIELQREPIKGAKLQLPKHQP